ncbi:flavodoxin family protein [bacterium]|nr:flavodoxin family protein [bacterium]
MKIVIIYGSPRKGNSYKATQIFKDEMNKLSEIEFVEYFLPKDMPNFCRGCNLCFVAGEDKCPDYNYTKPILEQMLLADALIFTTPVYVLQTSGCMKSFLDHFGFLFIVHRPRPEMFRKKAFVIASTVGAGIKDAIKTIATSLKFWGVNRVYSFGFATFGEDWDNMNIKKREKIISRIRKEARKFYQEVASGKIHYPYLYILLMFYIRKMIMKRFERESSLDRRYWTEKGWFTGENSPFRKLGGKAP